ncbi:MAG: extracellular solute-binding protein [Pseudonocardiaceae bacterium]
MTALAVLGGCDAPSRAGAGVGSVRLLYAGSLTRIMNSAIVEGFQTATGGSLIAEPGPSDGQAEEISGRTKQADVFLSAAPEANARLIGAAHGDWEAWYASFAISPLVLGYTPQSRFAAALRAQPWSAVVTQPGFRLGNVDPRLHPKGNLAAQAMRQAGVDPATAIPSPEDELLAQLQTGQLDAAFFYCTEAAQADIPTVEVSGDTPLNATYTITVLTRAPNPTGGAAFVSYLLGPAGSAILRSHGVQPIPPTLNGDPNAVPAQLRPLLNR